MELSTVANIDNAKVNEIQKMKKVLELNSKEKVMADDQHKNAQADQFIFPKKEVILDNVKFGYNRNSQDFFVKVIRGEAEYKYPTEDMMRAKAKLNEEFQQKLKETNI